MARIARLASLVVAALVLGLPSAAPAQHAPSSPPSSPPSPPAIGGSGTLPARPSGQGIAVLAVGPSRDEAFALARAIYGSRLRPHALDEVRARVLAGSPPPANSSRELRELAEVRAGILTGEDAAGRRLLTGLAQQVGAEALLVVRIERTAAVAPAAAAGPPADTGDGGGSPAATAATDGGASAAPPVDVGNLPTATTVIARLFLAEPGDFDAARYSPEPGLEGAAAWRGVVTSLEARFPVASRAVGAPSTALSSTPSKIPTEDAKGSAFYTSGWFWGALGGAALLGAAFYFVSRDTGSDPIHLQMRVPR